MRGALKLVVLSAVALIAGCASEDTGSLNGRLGSRGDGDTQGSGNAAANANGGATTLSAAATACSAAAAPASISDAKDAQDVHLAGTAIFFQTGTSVQRFLKTGTGKTTVFTSDNLVHSWVDKSAILLVERTDDGNPNATLRTFAATTADPGDDGAPAPDPAFPSFPIDPTAPDPGGTTANTNFNAAGVTVFASDDTGFYVSATDGNGQAQIVKYNKGDLGATVLATSDSVISSPQLASGAVWYVEDNQRVWKVALQDDDGDVDTTAKEVFGISYDQCNLAVNETAAYCSVGSAIESRSLSGSTPKTLMDVTASKVNAPFGTAQYFGGELYVRNLSPAADVKNVLRAVSTTDASEKFVACNRAQITGVAVDNDTIAWTEDGAGVFTTKR